ncbi:MAG: O-antigen ligase family protein [Chloroflexi bacterium]|nr:O-antigen ligase family protein [Chloroflexota bacterium]
MALRVSQTLPQPATVRPWGVAAAAALPALGIGVAVAPPLYAIGAVVAVAVLIGIFIRPEIGLYLLALSVPFQSLSGSDPTQVKLTITEAFVALAMASFFARQMAAERPDWRYAPLLKPMALLLGAMLLSIFKAGDQLQSLKEMAKWLELLAVYWLAANLLVERRRLVTFLAFLTVGLLLEAALGAAQVVLRIGPPEFLIGGLILRAYGTFGQPNPFAGYLNLGLPVLLGVALFTDKGVLRCAAWLAAAYVALVMVTTLSRGAWLGFASALVVIGLLSSRRVATWIWLGLLVVALVIFAALFGIIPFAASTRVLAAFGLSGVSLDSVTPDNFSAVQRLAFWQAGLNMFDNNPVLGVGIGNYIDVYPTYAAQGWETVLGHAHDYYLNTAAETGLVGLTAYLVFVGAAFRHVGNVVHGAPKGVWYGVALGLLGSLTAISVHNLVDNMYVHGIPVLLGLLLGSATAISRFQPADQPVNG